MNITDPFWAGLAAVAAVGLLFDISRKLSHICDELRKANDHLREEEHRRRAPSSPL
jgi:hypothetical protein